MNDLAPNIGHQKPMGGIRQAPAALHVIGAIARRELNLGARRKLVRLLFLGSILPPIVLAVILVVKTMAEQMSGFEFGFDPMIQFLTFQSLPVALLALGLGTPIVARDRAEEVLFLYSTRPVHPWHYALGKLLAVAVPVGALLLFPGILIAVFRLGIVGNITALGALWMVAKLAVAAIAVAIGFAGVTVGPSAVTRKARWALFLALVLFTVPDSVVQATAALLDIDDAWPGGPNTGIKTLLDGLFDGGPNGLIGLLVLLGYGALGYFATTWRVRSEMRP